MKKFKLGKNLKLCKNRSFQAVYKRGRSFSNRQAVLYVLPNKTKTSRIGFAAGKRLGCAVIRNRVKRILREAYRLNQEKLTKGADLVLVGRQSLIKADLQTATRAFLDLCRKAGILKTAQGDEHG
ncbi:MAG: ribonuclease P protein component [Sporomusaceae bacterium]|nr:ribonuclease P protein component [Sporomusaceae bacterium]